LAIRILYIENAWGEPSLANVSPGKIFQFERLGYFVRTPDTASGGKPVFNKTIGLRDTWAKIANKGELHFLDGTARKRCLTLKHDRCYKLSNMPIKSGMDLLLSMECKTLPFMPPSLISIAGTV
jgi:hypothetical protein